MIAAVRPDHNGALRAKRRRFGNNAVTRWAPYNVCRDRLRSEARQPRAQPLSPATEECLAWLRDGGESARADARAASEVVELLLGQLPAADRLVLTLLDLEGRPVAEIAELTGWSRTLVKVRAFRARRRLRAAAERWSGDRP